MMAGGITYRLGRVGVMAAGGGNLSRVLSVGVGLGAEVTAFEMTHRSLGQLTGEGRFNPNLWRWSGQGGIRQGLLSSLITFGSLKGAGRLAQGENVVVQHLLQDTGMVLGHQVSGVFGVTPQPTGSLAEQFLHAEATNLQLGAGMALAHHVAPGIQGLERGLDLSLRETDAGTRLSDFSNSLQVGSRPAFAMATNGAEARDPRGIQISAMSAIDSPDRADAPLETTPLPSSEVREKSLPPPAEKVSDSGIGSGEPLLPRRTERDGLEPSLEVPQILERVGEETRSEILSLLSFSASEVRKLNPEDLGRGLGILLNRHADRVLNLGSPELKGKRYDDLDPEMQRSVRLLDEAVGIIEYARRAQDMAGILREVRNAVDEIIPALYVSMKDLLREVMGPHFDAPQGPRAQGKEVVEGHEAVLAIGSGDMTATLALLRHRVRPGELSWRWQSFAVATSPEVAEVWNETGRYPRRLKDRQINFDQDPRIQATAFPQPLENVLKRTVRVQLLNIPSDSLPDVLTDAYLDQLPENAILVSGIGGLTQEGDTPQEYIRARLDARRRNDVEVVSMVGFMPGRMMWEGDLVEVNFSSREHEEGKGPNPAASTIARLFAGEQMENDYIIATTSHWDLSNNVGKSAKNVFTLMAGLFAGRLARGATKGGVNVEQVVLNRGEPVIDPERAELRYRRAAGEIWQMMVSLLVNNEGIKPSKARYRREIQNDYEGGAAIDFQEVMTIFGLAGQIPAEERTPARLREFLEEHVVRNQRIAATRNPKRGIAQALHEMWRDEGFPLSYEAIMPALTQEGYMSLNPMMRRYHRPSRPMEQQRLPEPVYDLFRSFFPNRNLELSPLISDSIRSALRGKVQGINSDELRRALEGRSEKTLRLLGREIDDLSEKRAASDPHANQQEQVVARLIQAMREHDNVYRIDRSPILQPPYESLFILRLGDHEKDPVRSNYVHIRVNAADIMNRLTNLGMLLKHFEEKRPVKLNIELMGDVSDGALEEISGTFNHILESFTQYREVRINAEIFLPDRRGINRIVLQSEAPGKRGRVDDAYFSALAPLVDRLNRSPDHQLVSGQEIRNESANPARLFSSLIQSSRGWPMLLDYKGGPLHQAIRGALTRPERMTFIGIYVEGRLVDAFDVYRNAENQPLALNRTVIKRLSAFVPELKEASSIDYFDGLPLDVFLNHYETMATEAGIKGLEYRILPIRSMPLEEALVGRIDGVNPALLRRFLHEDSDARGRLLEEITPFYEGALYNRRQQVIDIFLKYLNPYAEANRESLGQDSLYEYFEKYRAFFLRNGRNGNGSEPPAD
jgi:hypothetical protein